MICKWNYFQWNEMKFHINDLNEMKWSKVIKVKIIIINDNNYNYIIFWWEILLHFDVIVIIMSNLTPKNPFHQNQTPSSSTSSIPSSSPKSPSRLIKHNLCLLTPPISPCSHSGSGSGTPLELTIERPETPDGEKLDLRQLSLALTRLLYPKVSFKLTLILFLLVSFCCLVAYSLRCFALLCFAKLYSTVLYCTVL